MRLLILTQKVDRDDPVLGFFHNWIKKLAEKFDNIVVVCLQKGQFDLPKNVKVFSLGKESGSSRIKYLKNFYNFILGLHREYDRVFVHMNQEYVLLGGWLWKVMRKKVYLWRNHPKGNFLTRIAVFFSKKVFYTSKFAYVAKYKKSILMPVGIDTSIFNNESKNINESTSNKILFLSRIDKIKNPELLIDALNILDKQNINFISNFYGDPTTGGESYYEFLKEKVKKLNLQNKLNFFGGVPNIETPAIYKSHKIFVNLTPSGSFDKTILEAAACGSIPIMLNLSLEGQIDQNMIIKNADAQSVANTIKYWLEAKIDMAYEESTKLQNVVYQHSLDTLIIKLSSEIKK